MSELVQEVKCLHCGLDVNGGGQFCCPGCYGAYNLIQEFSLGDYYTIKRDQIVAPVVESAADEEFREQFSQHKKETSTGSLVVEIYVSGMSCSACLWLLEKLPVIYDELKAVEVTWNDKKVLLEVDQKVDASMIWYWFNRFGFKPSFEAPQQNEKKSDEVNNLILRASVALACMMATMHVSTFLFAGYLNGMSVAMVTAVSFINLVMSLPAVFFSALPFYRGALLSIKARSPNIDLLASVTVAFAFLVSMKNTFSGTETYFEALTMLIGLLLAGRATVAFIESKFSVARQASISNVLAASSKLVPGQKVIVPAGEYIPCDGVIETGHTQVDISWLTGESDPKELKPGSKVFAGSINLRSQITVVCKSVGNETRIGKIVNRAFKVTRGVFSRKLQKLEAYIVSTILLTVVGLLGAWFYGYVSLSVIVALIVVTCPCALGLAVPAVMTTALRQSLKQKYFIKESSVLEKLGSVDTIIFDKTGTLTEGYAIGQEQWLESSLEGFSRPELDNILANLVHQSSHPKTTVLKKKVKVTQPIVVEEFTGKGVSLTCQNTQFRLGKPDFVVGDSTLSDKWDLVFGCRGKALAVFSIKQRLVSGVEAFFNKYRGTKEIFILSGDLDKKVQELANRLGLERSKVFSQCSPDDKLKVIEEIGHGKNTVMVGDGLNDILALKKSDVSISVAGDPLQVVDGSDIVLPATTFSSLDRLLEAGKKIRSACYLNVAWALLYNVVAVSLVFLGFLGPLVCAVLMPLSSLTVIGLSVSRRFFTEVA